MRKNVNPAVERAEPQEKEQKGITAEDGAYAEASPRQDGNLPRQKFNRIVLEFPEALVDRIDKDLMPAVGCKTRSVFISAAVEFYVWAIQEVIHGSAVGALTHDRKKGAVFRTNETAGLQNLKRWLDKKENAPAVSS